jgi:hypothetical protein
MGLVDQQGDAAAALQLFDGEQHLGLSHDLGLEEAGLGAERRDQGDVEAAGTQGGRVGEVDDLVGGGVELGDGGARRTLRS